METVDYWRAIHCACSLRADWAHSRPTATISLWFVVTESVRDANIKGNMLSLFVVCGRIQQRPIIALNMLRRNLSPQVNWSRQQLHTESCQPKTHQRCSQLYLLCATPQWCKQKKNIPRRIRSRLGQANKQERSDQWEFRAVFSHRHWYQPIIMTFYFDLRWPCSFSLISLEE